MSKAEPAAAEPAAAEPAAVTPGVEGSSFGTNLANKGWTLIGDFDNPSVLKVFMIRPYIFFLLAVLVSFIILGKGDWSSYTISIIWIITGLICVSSFIAQLASRK